MQSTRGDASVKRHRRQVEPAEKSADDAVLTEVWECMRPRLAHCLRAALRDVLFFSHATSIQRSTVPIFCRSGTSVLVEASTGSGKTLAFLLPVLQRILATNEESVRTTGLPCRTKDIAALILSPSITLARQTFVACKQLSTGADYNIRCVLWGDVKGNYKADYERYVKIPPGGGSVVVATPTSLLDVLSYANTMKKQWLVPRATPLTVVIDEADVILDKQRALMNACLKHFPPKVNFGLFGATVSSTQAVEQFIESVNLTLEECVPKDIQETSIVPIERHDEDDSIPTGDETPGNDVDDEEDPQRHAGRIYRIFDGQSTLINLRNCHLYAPASQSLSALIHLLNKHPKKKHFIFFNNPETLEYVSAILTKLAAQKEQGLLWDLKVYGLHQGISEGRKNTRFKEFLNDPKGVLLSTDVCCFGIDVREVDYVLHFQPPVEKRVYVHRIGRTGRMGCTGTSVLMLPLEMKEEMAPFVKDITATFSSEEYRLPLRGFDAMPMITNLLTTDADLHQLAIKAACSTIKKLTGRSLAVALCTLGIDEVLANEVMQAQQLEEEKAESANSDTPPAEETTPGQMSAPKRKAAKKRAPGKKPTAKKRKLK